MSGREAATADARLARVPIVAQSGPSECGPAVLEMVLRYYGRADARRRVRRTAGYSAVGLTMESLRVAAIECGLDAEGFAVPADQLGAIPAPAILHWRRGHFVVFEGMSRGRFAVVDPAAGRLLLDHDEFGRLYSGVALALEPSENADWRDPDKDGSAPVGMWHPAWDTLRPWLHDERHSLVLLAAAVLAEGAALVMVSSAGGQAAAAWVAGAPSAAALAVAIAAAAATAMAWFAGTRLDAGLVERLGAYVTDHFAAGAASAIPSYLATRTDRYLEFLAGDLDPTVNAQVPTPGALLHGLSALVVLAALATIDRRLAAATAAVLVFELGIAAWERRANVRRVGRTRALVHDARKAALAALHRPEPLQAAGVFGTALDRWRALRRVAHAAVADRQRRPPSTDARLAAELTVLATLALIAPAAVRLPLADTLSAVALSAAALAAMHATLRGLRALLDWTIPLARLRDLHDEARETRAAAPPGLAGPSTTMAALECRALTYRAPAADTPVLRDVDLVVAPGEAVAVIGGEWERRTPFARLLLGLLSPTGGAALVNGYEIGTLAEAERRLLIAGVLDGAEPEAGTVLDQFRLVDPTCSRATVLRACAAVGLATWVSSLPLREGTPVTRSVAFDEHHRRLLCLAAQLVRPPRVLVLEGTLDRFEIVTARRLTRSLAALGCAVVLCTSRPEIVPPGYRCINLPPP